MKRNSDRQEETKVAVKTITTSECEPIGYVSIAKTARTRTSRHRTDTVDTGIGLLVLCLLAVSALVLCVLAFYTVILPMGEGQLFS